jgi:hypothetical protein
MVAGLVAAVVVYRLLRARSASEAPDADAE